MEASWTTEQVLGLAPDESGARAARGLASPRSWPETGRDERSLWGLCQGSGKKPYQVQVDLSEPAYKCTCPSRKFPCKHALGLLLLWAADASALPPGEPPEWVTEWLATRDERAEKSRERREQKAEQAPDPEAQARRAEQREARVAEGVAELRRWLADLVRQGLADARRRPYGFWDEAAARMVDAQAQGLARMLRRMGGTAASGEGWEERLLEQAGLLHLLLEAHARLDELPAPTRDDVAALIGRPQAQEEALAAAPVRDRWAVLGQSLTEDDRLRTLRTWLWGCETGRGALVLAFAPPGQPLDQGLVVGTAIDADLGFFASAHPLRAVVAERHGAPEPLADAPGWESVAQALAARAGALAAQPWLDRLPASLAGVVPARDGRRWVLVDRSGDALALGGPEDRLWRLASLSGGHPLTVFGEWERERVVALSAFGDGRLVPL